MPKSDTGTHIRSEVKETPALPGNQFATPAPEAPVATPAPSVEQPAAPAVEE